MAGGTWSFGAGDYDFWVLKLDGSGNITGCSAEGSSNATVTTTNVSGANSSATPANTNVTPGTSTATIEDTDVTAGEVCGGGPDLIVSALSARLRTYGTFMIRSVFVKYQVRNVGSADAGASRIDFYLSRDTVVDAGDVYIGSQNLPVIVGGGAYSSFANYTLPASKWRQASGTWHVIAVADAGDDVEESDETNNQASVVGSIVMK